MIFTYINIMKGSNENFAWNLIINQNLSLKFDEFNKLIFMLFYTTLYFEFEIFVRLINYLFWYIIIISEINRKSSNFEELLKCSPWSVTYKSVEKRMCHNCDTI